MSGLSYTVEPQTMALARLDDVDDDVIDEMTMTSAEKIQRLERQAGLQ